MKSARTAYQAILDAGIPADDAMAMIQKGLGTTYTDDLQKGLLASVAKADLLTKGLSDEDAVATVQKMIASGSVVDDLGLAKGIDLAALDAMIDTLKKGSETAAPDLARIEFDAEQYADDLERASALAGTFATKADEVVKAAHNDRSDLLKGFATLADAFKSLATGVSSALAANTTRVDGLEKGVSAQLDTISSALMIPMPPRTLSGAVAAPSPADLKKGAEDAASFGSRQEAASKKAMSELKKGGSDQGLWNEAVQRITAGESYVTVAADLGLDF